MLIAAVTGCTDYSVTVTFELPEAYRDSVRATVVDVLVPVAGAFDCDDVAFQEVSAETIALSRVQSVVIERGDGAPLSGIPRAGTKLFYARGVDSQGAAVVAACAALGDVEGDELVELVGEPAAVVAAPAIPLGDPLPESIRVPIRDVRSETIPDVELRWRATGAAGAYQEGSGFTDDRGELVVRPIAPPGAGPVALVLRARWSRDAPTRLAVFQPPGAGVTAALPAGDGDDALPTDGRAVVGRLGPQGQVGIAAIGPIVDGGVSRAVTIAYYDGAADPPFRSAVTDPIPAVVTLGLARGAERDAVVTAAVGQWIEVLPDGGLRASPFAGGAGTARRILSVGPCASDGAGGEDRLLVQYLTTTAPHDVVTPAGALAPSPFAELDPGTPLVSGCAADVAGAPARVVVFHQLASRHTVYADMDALRRTEWITFPEGVGFAPAIGGEPASLLGLRVAVDGTSIARHQLLPLGTMGLELQTVAQDASTTPPLSTAAGDIDGDGALDIVAVLDFGRSDEGAQFRVFIARGAEADGERVAAVSDVVVGEDAAVFVADVDDDGVDDIAFVTTDGIAVWSMGAGL